MKIRAIVVRLIAILTLKRPQILTDDIYMRFQSASSCRAMTKIIPIALILSSLHTHDIYMREQTISCRVSRLTSGPFAQQILNSWVKILMNLESSFIISFKFIFKILSFAQIYIFSARIPLKKWWFEWTSESYEPHIPPRPLLLAFRPLPLLSSARMSFVSAPKLSFIFKTLSIEIKYRFFF